MKLSKNQLRRIIREAIKSKGLNQYAKMDTSGIYRRPQHPMIAQGQANNHLGLLARAVGACLDKGMSIDEICELCEEECLNQTMRDQF